MEYIFYDFPMREMTQQGIETNFNGKDSGQGIVMRFRQETSTKAYRWYREAAGMRNLLVLSQEA